MDVKLGSWTLLEAESVSEGVNAVIYKDSNSGDVAYWQLDMNGIMKLVHRK